MVGSSMFLFARIIPKCLLNKKLSPKMKTEFVVILLLYTALATLKAQEDPQDIAETACASSTSIYEFNSVDGYIESPGYPDSEYDDYEDCQWYLNPTGGIPNGQELYLQVEFFDTESCCDEIWVREGEGTGGTVLYELAGTYSPGQFFTLGDVPVTLHFDSDGSITDPGFRVYFYMGEASPGQEIAEVACDDTTLPAYVFNDTNLIESPNYPAPYPAYTHCEWIITPDNNVNGIFLNIIYYYAYDDMYIYFGDDPTGSDYEYYLYGSYSAGWSVYTPGNALSMRFITNEEDPGFQMVYYQLDPACSSGSASIVDVAEKAELKSPGYPYDVPEHLSCRWLLEAPVGQKVTITALDLNLAGDGVTCDEEYVEILDGDAVDALSLGKFCGSVNFGTIPSTSSALQVYFRTHDTSDGVIRTGFRFEYEAFS